MLSWLGIHWFACDISRLMAQCCTAAHLLTVVALFVAAATLQDGKSFLHIAAWEGRSTNAHSVTLISGGCLVTDTAAYADFADTMLAAGQEGCNVRSVNNATLIPTLLTEGSLPTPQPLLVLITANVSLGFGLKAGSIPINRPVVMAGLYSVPTSMDMYMVVNQLNVTSKPLGYLALTQLQ